MVTCKQTSVSSYTATDSYFPNDDGQLVKITRDAEAPNNVRFLNILYSSTILWINQIVFFYFVVGGQ